MLGNFELTRMWESWYYLDTTTLICKNEKDSLFHSNNFAEMRQRQPKKFTFSRSKRNSPKRK